MSGDKRTENTSLYGRLASEPNMNLAPVQGIQPSTQCIPPQHYMCLFRLSKPLEGTVARVHARGGYTQTWSVLYPRIIIPTCTAITHISFLTIFLIWCCLTCSNPYNLITLRCHEDCWIVPVKITEIKTFCFMNLLLHRHYLVHLHLVHFCILHFVF